MRVRSPTRCWATQGLSLGIPALSAGALLVAIISVRWIGHLQLLPIFYVMLALLALYRIYDTGEGAPAPRVRRAWIGVFCACAAEELGYRQYHTGNLPRVHSWLLMDRQARWRSSGLPHC